MTVHRGYLADVYWGGYSSTAMTTEAMTDSGDHLTYTITNAAKRFWDPSATWIVYSDAVPITTYTPQYCGGKVTFTASQEAKAITVTGKYFALTQAAQARSWSISLTWEKEDTTVFGDAGRVQTPTQLSGTATVSRLYPGSGGKGIETIAPDTYPLTGLVLYEIQASAVRFECYAVPDVEITVESGNIIPETINFTILGNYGVYHYDS